MIGANTTIEKPDAQNLQNIADFIVANHVTVYKTFFLTKDKIVQQFFFCLQYATFNAILTGKKSDFLIPLTVLNVQPVGPFSGNVLTLCLSNYLPELCK